MESLWADLARHAGPLTLDSKPDARRALADACYSVPVGSYELPHHFLWDRDSGVVGGDDKGIRGHRPDAEKTMQVSLNNHPKASILQLVAVGCRRDLASAYFLALVLACVTWSVPASTASKWMQSVPQSEHIKPNALWRSFVLAGGNLIVS
jgi:hypothetical protein